MMLGTSLQGKVTVRGKPCWPFLCGRPSWRRRRAGRKGQRVDAQPLLPRTPGNLLEARLLLFSPKLAWPAPEVQNEDALYCHSLRPSDLAFLGNKVNIRVSIWLSPQPFFTAGPELRWERLCSWAHTPHTRHRW